MRFLFEDMDVLRQKGFIRAVPSYVTENLRYTLRPYQLLALENFITFYESDTSPRPLQVLFHMATGSGKTLVMAGLIVYLYQQGYRDFLFFVNLSNIVEKTRCNFITPTSPKYLFRDPVVIDGQKVSIRQVNNFQSTTKDAINICFATTQGLHMDLWQPHENRTTWEDFVDRKTVLISDEAHHLNVETARRRSRSAETDLRTWEETARRILEANRSNVLLEFTATCDLSNPYIENEYRQKIIANYPLRDYYRDGYSKDIVTHRAHADRLDRALHAVILSEYRQRLFADCGLRVKPVVLFKARTIPESEEFERSFRIEIAGITADRLDSVLKGTDSPFVAKAVQYFEDKGISLQQLAAEIRDDFGPEHCISVNEQKQAVDYQIALNTLESPDNPYRAIFEVRKLDEGWDVLNLFDIVRLYETRQSGGNRTSRTTISEAQLIGRGARYFPFALEETDDEFLRKFDQDVTNDLRVCEQLLYHCQNDSRYIAELQNALREIGLDSGNVVERHLTLKPEFKQTEIYRNGWLFLNKRVEKSREDITSLPESLKCSMFWIRTKDGTTAIDRIMDDVPIAGTDTAPTYRFTVAEIAQRNYNIVRKALVQRPLLRFDELRRRFPNLRSMSQFILDDAYMGGISLHVRSNVEPTGMELFQAMVLVAKEIAEVLEATHVSYEGTRTFYEREIRALFHDHQSASQNLARNEPVSMQTLEHICTALDCNICNSSAQDS